MFRDVLCRLTLRMLASSAEYHGGLLGLVQLQRGVDFQRLAQSARKRSGLGRVTAEEIREMWEPSTLHAFLTWKHFPARAVADALTLWVGETMVECFADNVADCFAVCASEFMLDEGGEVTRALETALFSPS